MFMPPPLTHILVVLDPGSKQQPALERGAWLAERTGAMLELFVCVYDQDLTAYRGLDSDALALARRQLVAAHRRTLEAHAKQLNARGIRARVDVSFEHPQDAGVVRKAAQTHTDLVLKGTRYSAELSRSLFSAADWNLIAHCPATLWLVKPKPMAPTPRIFAAIDPREQTDAAPSIVERILDTAATLEQAVDGELHVLHGFDISAALAASSHILAAPIAAPVRDLRSSVARDHEQAVLAAATRYSLAAERIHVREGPARRLLLAWAREMNADLLALSALSRSALPRKLIGSTAEQVLDEAPCDLLIVPPRGQA